MADAAPQRTGVVLAGGRASRMGGEKAALDLGGRTLLQHAVDALATVVDEIVIVGAPGRALPEVRARVPLRRVDDAIAGAGPLAGIAAGLSAAQAPVALIVGCDMPFLSPALLRLLADRVASGAPVVVPVHAGVPQPLCSAWRTSLAGEVTARLRRGERSPADVARTLDAVFLAGEAYASADAAGRSFTSLDTPEAYAAALAGPGVRGRAVLVSEHRGAQTIERGDIVAVEEPLELRLGETPLAVVMRTPGDDVDLARGFLLTEGIVLHPAEIAEIERIDGAHVSARLAVGTVVDPAQFQRNMFVSSSCGVCGKASIEAVRLLARPARPFTVRADVVGSLTARLRAQQPTFDATGGLHAAALFDVHGALLAAREDVGRHNAVDKVIGAAMQQAWPLPPSVLVVSGRQSFEVVQKAAMAGIGALVGVSAPSSLAVELADELGMLLVGFARGDGFNVYAGGGRLAD